MNKLLMTAICTILSISISAKIVSFELTSEEIELAINLSDKYEVPLDVFGPCSKTEFTIIDVVKGFNPAIWIIKKEALNAKLAGDEIQRLIEIHNRLNVPAMRIDSITLKSEITFTGSSCGFTPNKWTVTFDNLN
jgi:hypothetical protein